MGGEEPPILYMAQKHGAGKESFRQFTKTANELKRLTKKALKEGEFYYVEQVEDWYQDIVNDYQLELEAINVDTEFWLARAKSLAQEHIEYLINIYELIRRDSEDEEQEETETGDKETPIQYEFDELTEQECRDETPGYPGDGKGSPRNIILLTYEDLIEYFGNIPPEVIKGIIPVYQNGELVGYKPCILFDTQ